MSASRSTCAGSRRPYRRAGGFTLLEVMLSIVVMLAGIMGILAFQRVTIRTNYDARSTATATTNTSRWIAALRRSSLQWTTVGPAAGVPYLQQVGTGWFVPASGGTELYGMDWYGVPTETAADVRFCTLVRLQWVTQDQSMRGEVITFWANRGDSAATSGAEEFQALCVPGLAVAAATALNADAPASPVADSRLRIVRAGIVLRRVQP